MEMVKGKILNNGHQIDVLKHSMESVPEEVRQCIVRSKAEKGYRLRCCNFANGGMAGHLVHAFREILYSAGLNGNQEVRYEPRKKIDIYPNGLRVLQDILKD